MKIVKHEEMCVSVIVPVIHGQELSSGHFENLYKLLENRYSHFEIVIVEDSEFSASHGCIESILNTFNHVRYYKLAGQTGPDTLVSAGFDKAIGDAIVVCCLGFDPIERIPDLVDQVSKTEAVLIGQPTPLPLPIWERSVTALLSRLSRKVLKIDVLPQTYYFMALNRKHLNLINSIKDKTRSIKAFTGFTGVAIRLFKYQPVNAEFRFRRSLLESYSFFIDFIVSNSVVPLRLASVMMVLTSLFNLVWAVYVVAIALFKKRVAEGWVTLSGQSALNFFVISVALAVAFEAIGRILLETKARPLYFVVENRESSKSSTTEILNVVSDS